jgi:hypothetical protein
VTCSIPSINSGDLLSASGCTRQMVTMISMAHYLRPATPRGDPEFPANYYLRSMTRKAANVSDVRVPRHRDLF